MIEAIEYGVEHKILLASDFPSATIDNVINGLRNVNKAVEGTPLPKVPDEVIDAVVAVSHPERFVAYADAPPEEYEQPVRRAYRS